MSRLLIIGSRPFLIEAMQFAFRYDSELSVFCMLDRDEIMDEEVQECRPDTVVLDGITEGSGLLDRIPQIRAAAGDALIVVMIDDVSSESAERVIEADLVLCNWRGPARMRTPQREGGEGEVRRLSVAAEPRVERKRAQGGLTSRELEILRSVAEGCTNAAIARRLWVTEQTVKFHLTNIYRKLHVSNRSEASQYAVEHHLVLQESSDADTTDPVQAADDARAPDAPMQHR